MTFSVLFFLLLHFICFPTYIKKTKPPQTQTKLEKTCRSEKLEPNTHTSKIIPPSLSLSLRLSLSLSPSLSLSLSLYLSLSLSLSLRLSHSLTHSLSLSLSVCFSFCFSLSLSLSLPPFPSCCFSFSLYHIRSLCTPLSLSPSVAVSWLLNHSSWLLITTPGFCS